MKHIYKTCRIVFALLMCVVLINGCASGPQDPITDTPNVKHNKKTETTIFGRILDESHKPMQDVVLSKLYDNGSRYIGLVSGGSRSISVFHTDKRSAVIGKDTIRVWRLK